MGSIIRLIAAVVVLVTALGGYMSFRYSTTSTCEAAQKAIRDEMPKVLEELAENDLRFRALQVGAALLGSVDTVARGVATEVAAEKVADKSAIECAYMVGWRELDPSGFRKEMGETISDDLAERLSLPG